MTKWEMIKDLKGLLTAFLAALAVLVTITTSYLDWKLSERVDQAVAEALSHENIATDPKITSMASDIQANAAGVAANKERNDTTQRQLEAVAQILMRPPSE